MKITFWRCKCALLCLKARRVHPALPINISAARGNYCQYQHSGKHNFILVPPPDPKNADCIVLSSTRPVLASLFFHSFTTLNRCQTVRHFGFYTHAHAYAHTHTHTYLETDKRHGHEYGRAARTWTRKCRMYSDVDLQHGHGHAEWRS